MIQRSRIGAVLIALLVVASSGAVAVGSSGHFDGDGSIGQPDAADAVYVHENGDAILAYSGFEPEYATDRAVTNLSGDFGVDVESGLVHLFYSGAFADLDPDGEHPELTGDATLRATPDLVAGDADLRAEPPAGLVDVSAEIDHAQTRSRYDSSTSVSMVVENGDGADDELASDLPSPALDSLAYSSFALETETTATASRLDSRGSLAAVVDEAAPFADPDGPSERLEYAVTEDDDGYHLSVAERTAVTDWQRDRWDTREDAARTLESRYVETAIGLGGTATVALESYEFEDGGDDAPHVVAVEYEVTLSGVESRAAEVLAEEFADANELDLSEAEARTIADRIATLEIERASVSHETDGLETTVEWDVEIDRYDEFVLGVFAIAESIDELDDDLASQLDERRRLFEAQADADLVRTSSLAIAVDVDSETNRTSYEFSSASSADNWEAYVDEVEARGLEAFLAESVYDLSVESVDDGRELELGLAFETDHDGALDSEAALEDARTGSFLESFAENDDLLESGELEEFREAEFEAAKATVSFDETAASVRSAARFGNLSAFETSDGETITGVHAETDDGVTTTYFSVAEFVDEGASESAVRDRDRVGEDTAVYMPGEWDRDELPRTDVASLTEYLEEKDDSLLPGGVSGIGIAAGVGAAAVLGGLGVVAFRRFG